MNQYLKYIIRGFMLMLGAIMAVLLVFFLVQYYLQQPDKDESPAVVKTTQTDESPTIIDSKPTSDSVPAEGVYLRDLPLTDPQKSLATSLGIEVETYYITPETIGCIQQSIDQARYSEIIAGDTPSFVEAAKIVKCL